MEKLTAEQEELLQARLSRIKVKKNIFGMRYISYNEKSRARQLVIFGIFFFNLKHQTLINGKWKTNPWD